MKAPVFPTRVEESRTTPAINVFIQTNETGGTSKIENIPKIGPVAMKSLNSGTSLAVRTTRPIPLASAVAA